MASWKKRAFAPLSGSFLPAELGRELLGTPLQRSDAAPAQRCLLTRPAGVVGDHQAPVLPARFPDGLGVRGARLGLQGLQDLGEIAVAPPRHRQDELKRLCIGQRELGKRLDVVEREQPPVGDHDQAPNMRVTRQHLGERRQQRRHLGRMAGKDFVVDRNALCGLHDAEHELACDQALLAHSEAPHVACLLARPLGADGGPVVQDDQKYGVDQQAPA